MYLHYDQAALDAQYNMRLRHPDFQQIMDAGTVESERVRSELPAEWDVAYGDAPGQELEVFRASVEGGPVLLFIHGGYWRAMDKANFSFVAEHFARAGAAVVNINYALAPSVDMTEIVRQVREAVGWTYRNIHRYGGDPARLYISGHSAGGHLGGMCVTHDWTVEGLPANVIKGACLISGLYDLEPIRLCNVNDDLRLTAVQVRELSPQRLAVTGGTPVILAVGGDESEEFLRQTETQYRAWLSQGVRAAHVVVPGTHHFTVISSLGDRDSMLSRYMRGQMNL